MQRALATIMVLALAAVAVAQGGSHTASSSASPEYQKLVADYEAAKKRAVPVVNHGEFARRALDAAGKANGEEQVPFLVFAAQNGRSAKTTTQAVDLLLRDHVESPGLRGLLENYEVLASTLDADKGRELLARVIARSPHPLVRALALNLEGQRVLNARGASDEEKEQARARLAEAQKLAAGTDLADRLAGKGGNPNLQIGMPVPDIAGEDIDGTAFKLSDYRGKVVVLDFWGFW